MSSASSSALTGFPAKDPALAGSAGGGERPEAGQTRALAVSESFYNPVNSLIEAIGRGPGRDSIKLRRLLNQFPSLHTPKPYHRACNCIRETIESKGENSCDRMMK
jgi:hypothetical protein